MRAIVARDAIAATHPESLVDVDLPEPTPGPRDLLVAVRAVSVNPVDAKVRMRPRAPGAPPRVLGWDAAGVVTAVGDAVTSFEVGAEVYFAGDVTRPGTNAESCLVDERIVGRMPRTLDFAEAAAMPLTTLTAHEALFERMRLPRDARLRGKTLLVIGGAGGVGSMAIQLAKAFTDVTVIATASRDESRAWIARIGADHVVDRRGALGPQLARLGLDAVDYALCTADTDPWLPVLAELVAPQGALGFIVPPRAPIDMAPLHSKSVTVAWELMFTRSMFQTADMAEQRRILDEVSAATDAGLVRSTLTERLGPICARTLREAHARIESGRTIGKIVLEGWPCWSGDQ